jgi:small subunit ribosomal protein S4
VNGKKVDIPSNQVSVGDKIEFKDQFKKGIIISERKKVLEKFITPKWLKFDKKNITIEILRDPQREEIEVVFNPAQIIEFYSR